LKLFEAHFTFTPDDETAGEGSITISAQSQEEARTALLEVLGGTADLEVQEIRELAAIPDNDPTQDRPTLQ
jgi:hypothetical protein